MPAVGTGLTDRHPGVVVTIGSKPGGAWADGGFEFGLLAARDRWVSFPEAGARGRGADRGIRADRSKRMAWGRGPGGICSH